MARRRACKGGNFFGVIGCGIAAWPLAARAQRPTLPVIGFLDSGSPDGMGDYLAAFHRGLGEAGYTEGKNVAIQYRWAQSDPTRLQKAAAELVGLQVTTIVSSRGLATARAAKAATSTIPVVFPTGSDPVHNGLVVS